MELLVLLVLVLLIAGLAFLLLRSRSRGDTVSIQSNLEGLRSIGELSVFKAFTKEIVTEVDHSWGDFGRKYLDWIYSSKKMAMIFEFEIDFRYNLRHNEFRVVKTAEDTFEMCMPPCNYDVNIRNIEFYDEQHSKLLPWLLPDLLNGFIGGRFTEEHRNKLVMAARAHAEEQARRLIANLAEDVEGSARQTLIALGKSFGAVNVELNFQPDAAGEMAINVEQLFDKAA